MLIAARTHTRPKKRVRRSEGLVPNESVAIMLTAVYNHKVSIALSSEFFLITWQCDLRLETPNTDEFYSGILENYEFKCKIKT